MQIFTLDSSPTEVTYSQRYLGSCEPNVHARGGSEQVIACLRALEPPRIVIPTSSIAASKTRAYQITAAITYQSLDHRIVAFQLGGRGCG
jgi:hypothetical protein